MQNVRRVSVLASVAVASIVLLAGCERDREARQQPVVTRQDVYNLSKLDTAPPLVRGSFRRDFPDATVMSLSSTPTGGGPMRYTIVFTHGGQTDRVTCDETGAVIERPAGERDTGVGRPGFPENAPSGANAPAGR
jgi:hypothetical protein